jgi:hypothetical protein
LVVLTIGLIAALSPIAAASAQETLETCALPTGCVEVDAPEGVVNAVDETTGAVGKTLDGAKEGADKATGGWTQPVTDPVVDGINETLDLTGGIDDEGAGMGKKKAKRSGSAQNSGSTSTLANDRAAAAAAFERSVEALAAREAHQIDREVNQAASFVPPTSPDLADRLAQAALEVVKAFTFPAILIGLVVGFVLLQNRIDHKDPKLAFAPVSSEQEFLSFT